MGTSVEDIFSFLKQSFENKVGQHVEILINEVKKIDEQKSRIISKIDRSKYKITQYI